MMKILKLAAVIAFAATPVLAHDVNAVIAPSGICTMDINSCGHASICGCEGGYTYSPSVGMCLIDSVFLANMPGVPVATQQCAIMPEGICTRDINPAGHASSCTCAVGQTYSPVTGMCMVPPA